MEENLKFKFKLTEENISYDIIEAPNEEKAEYILNTKYSKVKHFRDLSPCISENYIKLEDKEIVSEEQCHSCKAKIKIKLFKSAFDKQYGQFVCPVCGVTIKPCNLCKKQSSCIAPNCYFINEKRDRVTILAVNGKRYAPKEEIETEEYFGKILEYLNGNELKIPTSQIEPGNIYHKAYLTLINNIKTVSYCNDTEGNRYRYAGNYTLNNKIRLYAEWLVPKIGKGVEVEEEVEFNSALFPILSLDYFSIDLEDDD